MIMKVDDVKQHVVDRFKVPIEEVEEEFLDLVDWLNKRNKSVIHLLPLKEKIDNLKALIPTIQSRKG
jgi:hypothetical protein